MEMLEINAEDVEKVAEMIDTDKRMLRQAGEELQDETIHFGSRVMSEPGKPSAQLQDMGDGALPTLLASVTSIQAMATQIKKTVEAEMLYRDELRRAQERDAREARENDSERPMDLFKDGE